MIERWSRGSIPKPKSNRVVVRRGIGWYRRTFKLDAADRDKNIELQFDGLAQVIVQSSGAAGEIKLTATADGLGPATAVVPVQPCAPRPSVP